MKVFLIAAQSLDGFIAQNQNQKSTKWTSKEDYLHFVEKSKEAGVVIMGRKTYETIGKPLKDRLNIVITHSPQKSHYPNLVFTHQPPEIIIKDLALKKYSQVAICGGASIYSLFLQKKLVDKIYLTIEPLVFGQGIKLFNQETETKLQLIKLEKANASGTLFLDYILKK